jgi:hypothetical protein
MAATSHHALPKPDASALFKPRLDINALADSVDTKFPKITKGTGAAPTSGMRDGDIHLQYSATALFDENEPLDPVV